ncbi:MAG: hypothetical protein CME70_19455 [Halobacteriovorax sp.]|nr:hypothetical protein [Halobacteriovorax sp.]MBK26184.1 hypothetical protein [Halobacteriovorax sp.]|tara:strand:+ start:265 stop:462 length:198 start_codon:yes stop_codon:yes gene_type:complete
MKVGDLVLFSTPKVFDSTTRSEPGLILIRNENHRPHTNKMQASYEVLWADGTTTKEWECYLRDAG